MDPKSNRPEKDFSRQERPLRRRNPPDSLEKGTGPLVNCRYRVADEEIQVPVYLLRLFQGGLTCVLLADPLNHPGMPECWMLRDGIDFPTYLRVIVLYYRIGKRVPGQFRPLRKIPPLIVENLVRVANHDLPAVFHELRKAGFLPILPSLTQKTCPVEIPWEQIRSLFQDFRVKNPVTGEAPSDGSPFQA